ncbi:MAG: DUF177 domain-containing protein [Flavobacteriales bacterium]|nr:DUF177 domain-containing protein [Flavobacteriales bacterium]HRH69393.1 DUF177 domain-containing protein [Flavobacteriales bacterium]
MEPLQDHTIAFSGLKDGEHAFRFILEQPFFDASGEEEWEGGNVTVDVTLDKSASLLVANMHATGTVTLRCDRCNAPLHFPLNGKQRQIFSLSGEEQMDDDELVSLDAREHSINLTHYIYECLRLALPIRHVHAPGQCDPEVEKVLSKLIVEHEPTPDPRWEVLKELKHEGPKPKR